MAELHVAIAALCRTVGGPATYASRLVPALAARGDVRLSVLTDDPERFPSLPDVDVVPLPMRGGLDRLRWQYVALPRTLRKLAPAVFHDTKNALPFGLRVPAVVTVHDLAYHTVPRSFGRLSRHFLQWATADAVRRARAVLVPSEATASDLRRLHPGCSERVHVAPHGIDPAKQLSADRLGEVRQRLALPTQYVLHVGTVQARKNVDLVVDAVRALRRRHPALRAVVVGRRGWLADAALQSLRADDTALWFEHVSAADLAAIYAQAAAFVSPSSYEGFGFAVADALAAGTPTIVSDISSLPELCGDAAVKLPELSRDAIADAITRVLETDALRATLRERGPRRANSFTWSAAAERHVAAYRFALNR